MLAWVVWVILFFTLTGCVLTIRYWISLLSEKDTYGRDELINFPDILINELKALSVNGATGYIATACGVGLAIFLTLLGGLLSPDTGPEPDWTSSQMPNYFFQSALSVLIFHLAWPSIRSLAEDSPMGTSFRSLLSCDDSFFTGMAIALSACSLSAWGVHHQISFLFVLINGLLLLFYAGYRLNLSRSRIAESPDYDSPYGDYSDDPDFESSVSRDDSEF